MCIGLLEEMTAIRLPTWMIIETNAGLREAQHH